VIAPERCSAAGYSARFRLVCDPVCCPLSGCPIALGECGESRGDHRRVNQLNGDQSVDEVLILLAESAELRHAKIFLVQAHSDELRFA
jgi:hypothetical protein